jgi:thiol-disulfide isomerase/thioredoxin
MRLAATALFATAVACGPRSAAPAPVPPAEKVIQVNTTGEAVDLERVLVPGHVTVIDFWATWCGACAIVDEKLMAAIASEPLVVVRKIDIGDGETPVARQHKVGALPHVRIYDRAGNLRYVLAGNDAMTAGEAARTLVTE